MTQKNLRVEGPFHLEAAIFDKLIYSASTKAEIQELETLSEDEMTIAQALELNALKSNNKSCVYNKVSITTDPKKETDLFYDFQNQTVIMTLGQVEFIFVKNPAGTFFECDRSFFESTGPEVKTMIKVAEAFRCDVEIMKHTTPLDATQPNIWELGEKNAED